MNIEQIEKELRDEKTIKQYGQMNPNQYKTWRNDLFNKLCYISNTNNTTKRKELFDLKYSLKYTIHHENTGGSYKNGIIGFLIAVLSGALIDEAVLKNIADAFSTNDLVTSIVLLIIIASLIVFGVIVKKNHDTTNYYEDVISIIDEAIDKIS